MSESIPFSPVPADEEGVIHVSAVVLADAAGRVLQVRKAGTEAFMFPGGKPQAGETYLLAAVRELAEETALTLAPADLASLGLRRTSAANEDGFGLAAAVYVGPVLDDEAAAAVTVHDEIEELAWVAPGEVDDEGGFPGGRLAPLSAASTSSAPSKASAKAWRYRIAPPITNTQRFSIVSPVFVSFWPGLALVPLPQLQHKGFVPLIAALVQQPFSQGPADAAVLLLQMAAGDKAAIPPISVKLAVGVGQLLPG